MEGKYKYTRQCLDSYLRPTPAHRLIAHIHNEGLLLRNFTQNIDTLEIAAGIPSEKGKLRLNNK